MRPTYDKQPMTVHSITSHIVRWNLGNSAMQKLAHSHCSHQQHSLEQMP